jgi:UDP-N-acetylmuramoylalanine--D-glutamate ligase
MGAGHLMNLPKDRRSDWSRVRAVVAGLGVSGYAAADALLQVGAQVIAVDDNETDAVRDKANLLELLGAQVRLGAGSSARLPADFPMTGILVTSSGWPPDTGIVKQAGALGVAVWGELELAWRLRDPEVPWLCLTGSNGKTTTVQMLTAMLVADGQRAVATGNVGLPLCEAVMDPARYDVFAVELSSHQLYYSQTLSAQAAAILNLAPDHVSWHGTYDAYVAAKARIYQRCQRACIYNAEDHRTEDLVRGAEVVDGCRAIGFTLGLPAVGMLGVVDGVLADRAFVDERQRSAAELATVDDVATGAPHNVANALAAAALARAHGVRADAVRRGLRGFRLDAHRIATVAIINDVRWVDDSKATNPAAAFAALRSFDSVVWLAGGLAKGASFDSLVPAVRDRLRGAVLFGADRALIAEAMARHAPDVPVIEEPGNDDGAMTRVVEAAASLAGPHDTVLLAPACASQDMFENYAERGDAFAAAVRGRRS